MNPLSDRLPKLILAFSAVIVLLILAFPLYNDWAAPGKQAVKGVLDLRDWDGQGKALRLDGEWEFYWDALLQPEDFAENGAAGRIPVRHSMVPSPWDSLQENGEPLPDEGYGTYRLRILLPEHHDLVYGIKTTNIRASNLIYANGEKIGGSGAPSPLPDAIIHRNTPYLAFFESRGNEVELLVQVASFKSFNSGIVQSVFFGSQHAVTQLNNVNNAMDGGLACGFFMMCLYFLSLFFQRPKTKELLLFSICCFATSLFLMTHSERLLMQLLPDLSIEMQLFIEDCSAIVMFTSFSRYVYYLFPDLYPRRVLYFIEGVGSLMALAVLFTSASYNGPFITLLSVSVLVVMLYNSWMMGVAARRKPSGSSYLYLGIIGVLNFVIVNFLNNMWKLEEHYFLPIALPLLVMSQALYMSKQYTESYQIIEDLSRDLSEMDRLKDEFLAKTSHELRTPLNGIINITESLLNGSGGGAVNARQEEDLRLVAETGRRLAGLVNDILDYSKMKHRDLRISPVHLDSGRVAGTVMGLFQRSADTERLLLENGIPPDEYFVYADENRLIQIFYNLIDNGVKYTDQGAVRLSAALDGGFVRFAVADTGPGIPVEQQQLIFESFVQVEPHLIRSRGGVGLGLAIARELVELHGGKLTVSSIAGQGSRFEFTIPLGDKDAASRQPSAERLEELRAEPLPLSSGRIREGEGRLSILIVEDDYSSLRALMNLLSLEQYAVTAVGNGQDALRELTGGKEYHLCIMDIMLPGMSGYDVCREIRLRYSMLQLPVLMVTAKSQYRDLMEGFAAGANDFVEKPYHHLELKSRVATLVQLKQATDELVHKELAFLQAQIKPHFLYNTLNTILAYSYTDHEQSRNLLQNFSIYLRHSFDFRLTREKQPLDKEIELIEAYLSIEKARFGDRLTTKLVIDPAARQVLMPPLILQPLVENAIRHGLLRKAEGGWLRITAVVQEGYLTCTVADNGVGMEKIREPELPVAVEARTEHGGVGLDNIRQRLRSLYGAELVITSSPETGTSISFSIGLE